VICTQSTVVAVQSGSKILAEAQDQQILDSVFAKIVIDAVDLLFFEDIENDFEPWR
jgi:hypothetical protein